MSEELDPFKIAQEQLDTAAQTMGLDEQAHAILREPMQTVQANIPVRMRDGKVRAFTGFRVLYNSARGPGKGGIRFHPQESLSTVKALAAWMTWKTSLANIPLGGAKGGVICDTKSMDGAELESLSRSYIRAVGRFVGVDLDVPAPDVYTTPQIMAWMMDEHSKLVGSNDDFGMITGKPLEVWGSEGRFDATAQGGMDVLREAANYYKMGIKGSRIAIQGFGNAGSYAFELAQKLGAKVVAISDSKGGIYDPNGLDFARLKETKEKTGSVMDYPGGEKITNEKLLELDTDVLIPAALENQITGSNADNIKAKLVLELANGPVTPEADSILLERGIPDLPDFLVNSGGVVVSYFEWAQNKAGYYWTQDEVYSRLSSIMSKSFADVVSTQLKYTNSGKKISPRTAAYIIAVGRVAAAMKARGWY